MFSNYRNQGQENFLGKSKVFVDFVAVIGLKSGFYRGLRGFFPFLLTAELNFFSVALRKVMTYWDLNRK